MVVEPVRDRWAAGTLCAVMSAIGTAQGGLCRMEGNAARLRPEAWLSPLDS
jgi:hypothetical protein